jgi:dihydroflavonol-4-reductase
VAASEDRPTVLITGASGFLGRHLVQRLVEQGEARPRVLSLELPPFWLDELGVEVVLGSLLEPGIADEAVAGVDGIYHLAGRGSRNPDDAREMYAIHVDGTRLLCDAARAAGVRRIVMASTSGTIAVSREADARPNERAPTPMSIIARWPYYASKYCQEQTAQKICDDGGPELVLLNPSLLLGPGDEALSSTQDVLRFLQRDIPTVPSGGLNFVDARDVAAAFVAAMERGRPGERYLLGGPNWTFAEFFGRLARMTKIAGPRLRAPRRLTLLGARAMDTLYRHFDRVPPVEYASVEMATYYWYLDDRKARRELGFVSRDPQETLHDTVTYLRENYLGSDAFATAEDRA